MINNGQLAGFYTAENVEKNPVDFGRKVKRWLHFDSIRACKLVLVPRFLCSRNRAGN